MLTFDHISHLTSKSCFALEKYYYFGILDSRPTIWHTFKTKSSTLNFWPPYNTNGVILSLRWIRGRAKHVLGPGLALFCSIFSADPDTYFIIRMVDLSYPTRLIGRTLARFIQLKRHRGFDHFITYMLVWVKDQYFILRWVKSCIFTCLIPVELQPFLQQLLR